MKAKSRLNISAVTLLAILLCFPSLLFAEVEEAVVKEIDLVRDGKVYLKNISGDITVKGWGKRKVLMKARKIARDREDLDYVSIDVSKTNGTVRIVTNYRRDRYGQHSNVSVHYDLSVPEDASVELETVSGDTKAESIGGHLAVSAVSGDVVVAEINMGTSVKTVSGDLRGKRVKGRTYAKTVSGEIRLQSVDGDVDASVVSGDIRIHDVQGSLEVESVSGGIKLDGITKAAVVEAKSVNGRLSYEGMLEARGNYRFSVHSGDVLVRLPAKSDFDLNAKTMSGDIHCDFDITHAEKITEKKIRGVVGKGGASLRLSSFSGDLRIMKQ